MFEKPGILIKVKTIPINVTVLSREKYEPHNGGDKISKIMIKVS